MKLAGAAVAIGAVGVVSAGLANAAARGLIKSPTITDSVVSTSTVAGPSLTDTVSATDTATLMVTETLTDYQTLVSTQTDTVTSTQTVTTSQTTTQTITVTETDVQTIDEVQTETETETQTVTNVLSSSAFSVFWITDTQFLSETNPSIYNSLTSWIVENWNAYNAKFVIHTGDMVQDGNVQQEWINADQAMGILLTNNIPYTWCAGNHDDLVGSDSSSGWAGNLWTSAFNPTYVSGVVNALPYTTWAGDYHEGMNTAATFTVDGLNFLVINIEWNAQPDALQWVENLLDDPAYANYYVIIAPHAYIDEFGATLLSSDNIDLTDFITQLTIIMDNHSSNVFLTLNGHYATDCGYNTPSPIDNRNQLMFDRQDSTDLPGDPTGRGADPSTPTTLDSAKVGGATVTILTFDVGNNEIFVSTYDVNEGKWRNDVYEQYSINLFATPLGTAVASTSQTSD